MSRILNSEAMPYSSEERIELDYHADLWMVPWRRFGFDFCGVYLIAPAGKWPVKVGMSEDAARRLNSLQTAHWQQMRIMSYWICENKAAARQIEAKCHAELKNKRMMGEWFDIKADAAADVVEFCGELLGIGLAKRVPETARFAQVKAHIESFYDARGRKFCT